MSARHEISDHLICQLRENNLAMATASGRWEQMILDEQFATLLRFLTYPHADLSA